MTDLGTLGGWESTARAINDVGQVVGCSWLGGPVTDRAFLYEPGRGMRDIGTLGGSLSCAYGINNQGQIVGWSYTTRDTAVHAFLWSESTGMIDLTPALRGSSIAADINDVGLVAGYRDSGVWRAATWSVTTRPATPAEETALLVEAIETLARDGVLSAGHAQALLATLDATTRHLAAGRDQAAARLLEAFIRQVEAFASAGQLPPAGAEALTAAARQVIAQLG